MRACDGGMRGGVLGGGGSGRSKKCDSQNRNGLPSKETRLSSLSSALLLFRSQTLSLLFFLLFFSLWSTRAVQCGGISA